MSLVTLKDIISGSQKFGVWRDLRGAMTDLIQALVDAFWQSYQKFHAEEFLLEQLERIVKGSEKPTQPVIDELEMNDPCP